MIAICASTKQSYPTRSKQNPDQSQTLGAGVVGSGYVVTCPSTKHVLGIGAYIGGPPGQVRVTATYSSDAFSGWTNDDADSIPDDNTGMSFSNRSSTPQATNGWAICG